MKFKNSWNKNDEMNHGMKLSKKEIAFTRYVKYLKTEKPKKKGNVSNEEN